MSELKLEHSNMDQLELRLPNAKAERGPGCEIEREGQVNNREWGEGKESVCLRNYGIKRGTHSQLGFRYARIDPLA
jgi:hypothetical protein